LVAEGDGLGEEGWGGVDIGEGVFVFCELANQFEDCWDVWFEVRS
jgi:hypothetical protein